MHSYGIGLNSSGCPVPHPRAVVGDLRSEADVRRACKGACLVVHMASYGMTGSEALNLPMVYSVNIGGTQVRVWGQWGG